VETTETVTYANSMWILLFVYIQRENGMLVLCNVIKLNKVGPTHMCANYAEEWASFTPKDFTLQEVTITLWGNAIKLSHWWQVQNLLSLDTAAYRTNNQESNCGMNE
jgi:hypothetical protein